MSSCTCQSTSETVCSCRLELTLPLSIPCTYIDCPKLDLEPPFKLARMISQENVSQHHHHPSPLNVGI
jgi:hypothetical protein